VVCVCVVCVCVFVWFVCVCVVCVCVCVCVCGVISQAVRPVDLRALKALIHNVVTTKMKAFCSSETSVHILTTRYPS